MKDIGRSTVRILVWAGVIAALLPIGCDMAESVSIEQRAQRFMRDLDNNSWGSLYTHIHPDEWRGIARSSETWTPGVFPTGRYQYSQITVVSSTANVTLSGSPPGEFQAGHQLALRMRRDGEVWYIIQIDHQGQKVLPP